MNILIYILILALGFVIYFMFNPTAVRIRKIQALLNKDRTVCDVINSINGWKIDNTSVDGLRILIDPKLMPIYPLYITYNLKRPTDLKIKELHHELTDANSIVTKAHKQNMPVEHYMKMIVK